MSIHTLTLCLCRSATCLTALDSTGETALHSAAKSKASGFARLFASVRKKGTHQKVLDLLGLQSLKVKQLHKTPV